MRTPDYVLSGHRDAFTRKYMKWKLEISIWKVPIGYEVRYQWLIKYKTPTAWIIYERVVPEDREKIAIDLWMYLDIEVAKIIYNVITDRYNDALVEMQNGGRYVSEAEVGNNTVINILFPPFEQFEDQIRRNRFSSSITTIFNNWSPITTASGTISSGDVNLYADDRYITDYRIWVANDELWDWFKDKCNSLNEIEYLSAEEYDKLREQGLSDKKLYLVYN